MQAGQLLHRPPIQAAFGSPIPTAKLPIGKTTTIDLLATEALIGTDLRMAAYPGELHLSATDGAHTGLQFVFKRHGTSYPQPSSRYKQSARFSRRKVAGHTKLQLGHLTFRALMQNIAVLIELRLYKIAEEGGRASRQDRAWHSPVPTVGVSRSSIRM